MAARRELVHQLKQRVQCAAFVGSERTATLQYQTDYRVPVLVSMSGDGPPDARRGLTKT